MELALICFEDWHLKERICWIVREGIPGKTNEAWLLFCMAIPCNISQNRQMTPKFSEMNSSIVEDAQRGSQILQDIFAVVWWRICVNWNTPQTAWLHRNREPTYMSWIGVLIACLSITGHAFLREATVLAFQDFFYKGKGGLSIWQVPPDNIHSFPAFTKVH